AEYPLLNIAKRAGVPMTGSTALHFDEKGAVTFSAMAISGQGFDAHGRISLDANGKFASASFSDVRSGTTNDFALDLEALAENGLSVRSEGKRIDATRLFGDDKKKDPKAPPPPADSETGIRNPLILSAKVDKAVFRDDAAFRDVNLAISFAASERLTGFSLDATGPVKGKVKGGFNTTKNVRSLSLTAEDAGNFIRTFTGF